MSEAAAVIDRLQLRAKAALDNSPFRDLHRIRVDREQDVLKLSGLVSSFYYKQLAQEVVRSVCRDVDLVNSIEVRWLDSE